MEDNNLFQRLDLMCIWTHLCVYLLYLDEVFEKCSSKNKQRFKYLSRILASECLFADDSIFGTKHVLQKNHEMKTMPAQSKN